jgi:hypothetical protein
MSYVVAIPTYDRASIIVKKTLTTLRMGGVPANCIYIFVANEQEAQIYAAAVPREYYHEMVIGVLGICYQRNFINSYFPEDQHIISIDDDIEGYITKGPRGELMKLEDVHNFFLHAFKTLHEYRLNIWGLYPMKNALFMRKEIRLGFLAIIGTTFGYINRHHHALYLTSIHGKEDIENSILYQRLDGAVLRFDQVTVNTKFNQPGGLGVARHEMNEKAANYLRAKHPDRVTKFYRKNGIADLRLSKKIKYAGIL